MNSAPYSITVQELAAAGKNGIPAELQSAKQLIYSSPATLAFNSPGAQGFGVKRAGLVVPESVMLLVAPGCCGRNTKLLSQIPGYENRFFFLLMDESDIVSGKHLERVPQAVCEILDFLPKKPSAVMICSTCVDALLGTDWDRVCRKAEAVAGLPVRPCYMYALTREGRKPPMVLVRQAVYSLLEPAERDPRTVNLLGHFSPLQEDSELYALLQSAGLRKIQEISRMQTFAEYKELSKANFNLILHPEARLAAEDMEKRLAIPFLEIRRQYRLDKIHRQYEILGQALGVRMDDRTYMEKAEKAVTEFAARHAGKRVAVGERLNANPFELSLALLQYGLQVAEIYANVTADDFFYLRALAGLSPMTRIYTNLSPTMLNYNSGSAMVDLTLGADAAYYQPDVGNVPWDDALQPFGYAGLESLLQRMDAALIGGR
jgi:nitrogenase molybdenum-cofactor synthesis protein NifE